MPPKDKPNENPVEEPKAEEPKEPGGNGTAPDLGKLFDELKLSDESKQVLIGLFSGVAGQLQQVNTRLGELEQNGSSAAADPADLSDLTPQQKYDILMARASAPAAKAQSEMWVNFLQSQLPNKKPAAGGGSMLDNLLGSAKQLEQLRSILIPPASHIEEAMSQAMIAQTFANARLTNRLSGKATTGLLDQLEKELLTPEPGPGEQTQS